MKSKENSNEPSQYGHINLAEPHEIQYWAERLGATEREIIDAVKQVGGSVDEVRKYVRARPSATHYDK